MSLGEKMSVTHEKRARLILSSAVVSFHYHHEESRFSLAYDAAHAFALAALRALG